MLKENRTLQHLEVSWNGLDEEITVMLAESLECNTTLEKLVLMFPDKGMHHAFLSAQEDRIEWVDGKLYS